MQRLLDKLYAKSKNVIIVQACTPTTYSSEELLYCADPTLFSILWDFDNKHKTLKKSNRDMILTKDATNTLDGKKTNEGIYREGRSDN